VSVVSFSTRHCRTFTLATLSNVLLVCFKGVDVFFFQIVMPISRDTSVVSPLGAGA